MLEKVMHKKK